MSLKKLSVIICQGRQDIIPCIESLKQQSLDKDLFEIIIIKDDSVEQQFDESLIKSLTVNTKSPTIKRNLGVEESSGKIINFVDDDEVFPRDYLEKAVSLFEKKDFDILGGPNIGMINQPFEEYLSDILLKYSLGSGARKKFKSNTKTVQTSSRDFSTCNLFILKDAFKSLKGFNKKLNYGGEDTEFLYRAEKAEMKFVFEPSLITWHQRRAFPIKHIKQLFTWGKNNGKLLTLHPSLIFRLDFFFPPIMMLIIIISAFILNFYQYVLMILVGLGLTFLITFFESKNIKDAFFFTVCFPLHFLSYSTGLIYTYFGLPLIYRKYKDSKKD